MPNSDYFKLYSDRIARCKNSDELLKISREIASKSFRANEKAALMIACVAAAKYFDKQNKKAGVFNEIPSLDCSDQE